MNNARGSQKNRRSYRSYSSGQNVNLTFPHNLRRSSLSETLANGWKLLVQVAWRSNQNMSI